MWRNTYKDYKPDEDWIKQKIEPGRGIIGCEMHELNGWGENFHIKKPKPKGPFRQMIHNMFKKN